MNDFQRIYYDNLSNIKNSFINIELIELPKELLNPEDKIEYNKHYFDNIIKKMYNLNFPSIQIEYDPNKIIINKENINKIFSEFGEIKYIYIFSNLNKLIIHYKYYFSSILAYDTLNENFNNNSNNIDYNNNLYEEIEKNINLNLNNLIDEISINDYDKNKEIEKNENKNINNKNFNDKENILLKNALIYRNLMINNIKNNQNNINNIFIHKLKINFDKSSKNKISFTTKQNCDYILKFVTNYQIQIENDDDFNVKDRILGKNGCFLKKIIYESCTKFNDFTTKIRLRGRGSGYIDRNNFTESQEPLQLCISSLSYYNYLNCCILVEILLKKIYKEYANYLKKKVSLNLRNNIQEKKIFKYSYIVDRFGNL